MPAASRLGDLTTGHGCFPPTAMVTTPVTSVYINGILALGLVSRAAPHSCGGTVHIGTQRDTNSSSETVFFNNCKAIRIGDGIVCGDAVGQGSPNVQCGG